MSLGKQIEKSRKALSELPDWMLKGADFTEEDIKELRKEFGTDGCDKCYDQHQNIRRTAERGKKAAFEMFESGCKNHESRITYAIYRYVPTCA